jgi:hypothetical protein
MNAPVDYKKHFKEFSQNVAYATRTWHHYVHLNNRAAEDKKILSSLNKAPRFWLDHRYSAVQTTILFLGKIFDTGTTFNIDKTIKSAHQEKKHFSKEKLRQRKIEMAGEFDGLDDYITKASELDGIDLKVISAEVKKAKSIWGRIKPLRDKIYAHNEILSDDERKSLYSQIKNSDIEDIIQILLNISNALIEVELNGNKPDFTNDYQRPIKEAHNEIENLIKSLIE